jgi:HEAT repeat protein
VTPAPSTPLETPLDAPPIAAAEPAAPAAPADAESPAAAPADAESPAAARRKKLAAARVDAEAARDRRRAVWLRRARTLLLALAAGALAVWLVRAPLLRAVARRAPGSDLGAWAVERLASGPDAQSFDVYVRELGRPGANHPLFQSLVYQLGGRAGFPAREGDDLLPEEASAVAEHTRTLHAGLTSDDPDLRRGALRALWALEAQPWAHTDDLLVAATQALASDDPVTRRYAALVLKANRGPALVNDALTRALATDPDGIVRKNAAQGLGRSGDAARSPALLAALDDQDPEVRREAALGLAQLGSAPPLDRLEDLLRSEEPPRRAEVLDAIARYETPRATALLLESLRDRAPVTRRAAVRGLSRREVDGAREGIERALQDADPEVRVEAAMALSTRADGRAAVPAIVAALPRHESWRELSELHEALRTLTGAEVEGPGPDSSTWPGVVSAWQRYLAERGGRAP